ncbi:leishmanolysin-related zinc metalloendopeptidase [Gemmatimonas sp.]|uniref:leishmanolysin-related zinc metalloendopeptidase n=1 Tax=Gemmatimonas sp. TaxID=1962908 RepID=UPI00286D7D4A|nr:leishmanolysin-related zinc metalloendopeptidase [Gemmatimonas sp.]
MHRTGRPNRFVRRLAVRLSTRVAFALGTVGALVACGGDQATAPIDAVSPITIVPAALIVADGDNQVGDPNTALPIVPSVRLLTEAGRPVPNVRVTFTPNANSGSVTRTTVVTDSTGYASAGAWTLGPGATQSLVASSTALPGSPVTFRATLRPSQFDIAVRFIGDGGTARQREAFAGAVARWRRVITGDVGTVPLNVPAGECQSWLPAVNESINDLLVFVRIATIDGPGKILGQASPCYVNSTNKLPIMGFFELDQDDLALLLTQGTLDNVVLHEMGHILGIGTLWNYQRQLLVGAGTDDPYFNGAESRAYYTSTPGFSSAGLGVPVENTGSTGTRDSHWRRSIFANELMQGYAQPGSMPLSRITVGSLSDMGYVTAMSGADAYSLLTAARIMSATASERAMSFGADIAAAPLYEVTQSGSRRLVRPALK